MKNKSGSNLVSCALGVLLGGALCKAPALFSQEPQTAPKNQDAKFSVVRAKSFVLEGDDGKTYDGMSVLTTKAYGEPQTYSSFSLRNYKTRQPRNRFDIVEPGISCQVWPDRATLDMNTPDGQHLLISTGKSGSNIALTTPEGNIDIKAGQDGEITILQNKNAKNERGSMVSGWPLPFVAAYTDIEKNKAVLTPEEPAE